MAGELGAAVAAPNTGVQPSPPTSPEDFEQRKQGFLSYFQHPQVQAAMLQMAISLAQPRSITQSPWGATMGALGEGMTAAGRVESQSEEEALKQRAMAVKEQEAAATTTTAGAHAQTAATGAAAQESEDKRGWEGLHIKNREVALLSDKQQADIDAAQKELELKARQVDILSGKAGHENELADAQAEYARSHARYADAMALNPAKSGQAIVLDRTAKALKDSSGGKLTDAQATIEAMKMMKSMGDYAPGRAKVAIMGNLSRIMQGSLDSMTGKPEDAIKKLQEQTDSVYNALYGTPDTTDGGASPGDTTLPDVTPGAAPAAESLPQDVVQQASSNNLKRVPGVSRKLTTKDGKAMELYLHQDTKGNPVWVYDRKVGNGRK